GCRYVCFSCSRQHTVSKRDWSSDVCSSDLELEVLFKDHDARVAIVWDKAAPTVEKLRDTTDLETIVSVNMTVAMSRRMQLLLSIPIPPITAKRDALTGEAPNTVPWATL